MDYETMLAAMETAAAAITRGDAIRDLITKARVRGVVAEPSRSRGYITDLYAAELALRAAGKRRRGFNIVFSGQPHDPMQRPGDKPVLRLTATPTPTAASPVPTALAKSAPATPNEPEPVLRTKFGDVLEEVEDEPTPCPYCRGRGFVVDDLGEHKTCPMCEGHCIVPVPE